MKSLLLHGAAIGALLIVGGVTARAAPAPAAAAVATGPLHFGTWGFDLSGEDRGVRPGDDFFTFADGDWIRRTTIPPDKTSFGAFDLLNDLSEARVHAILEAAAANPSASGSAVKFGAYYHAFMDENGIEKRGSTPLQPLLTEIAALASREALADYMGRAPKGYAASIYELSIEADAKNPTRYSVYLGQGGLGLPDRDYYLQPQFAAKKAAYQEYIAKLLMLVGWPDAQKAAPAIVEFETSIAQSSWTREEQRDPIKVYNPIATAKLTGFAPGFAWGAFLKTADLGATKEVVATTNTSLPKIAAIYANAPLTTLKAWEAFHVIDEAANMLPHAFVDARFEFRSHTLGGQPQLPVRWKRGVRQTNAALGDAVGQVYVAHFFPATSKAKMEVLIANLKAAFKVRIEHLDWMSAATKAEALRKLANFDVQIGYPKKWRDYTGLEVRTDDAFGNKARSSAFEWAYHVGRLAKPVDKDEWLLSPQTINAYNNPFFNEVVFPAAILQPPFFDPAADPAVNFGAIGGVIGHEMTHGFDDQGRKFDSTGRLRDWWTPEDAARFEAKSKVLGAQYEAFVPLPGLHIKGGLTMGENIADLGGLTLGLNAYRDSLGGHPAPMIAGLTGEQRVFLGWAQVWREKLRDDALRQQVTSDPHSPPDARVNGVVRNVDGWYKAWSVVPGDKLYLAPEARVHIW